MREPRPLQEWKLGALLRAQNEGVTVRADGVVVLTAGGACTLVGTALEGVQLDWMLNCGVHMRRCTPHAVKSERDLVCRYCTEDADLFEGQRAPTKHERAFLNGMALLQLDTRLRFEVQPRWWRGCVDFVDGPTRMLIQVDGEGHFQRTLYNVPSSQVLHRDADMCEAAWREGCVLVRVHHRDLPTGAGQRLAARLMREPRAGPLLVLSAHFNLPNPTPKHGFTKQLQLLSTLTSRLTAPTGVVMRSDAHKHIWIQPA